MQAIRNLTWWLIGLSTLIVFTLVLLLSNLLAGQFWEVPRSAIICTYAGIFLGFINRISALRLGETLVHEIGHAQIQVGLHTIIRAGSFGDYLQHSSLFADLSRVQFSF